MTSSVSLQELTSEMFGMCEWASNMPVSIADLNYSECEWGAKLGATFYEFEKFLKSKVIKIAELNLSKCLTTHGHASMQTHRDFRR